MAQRRQPGEVRDAIVDYLAGREEEATIPDIFAAVTSRLGGEVPPSSVRSYLRLNNGGVFERTARGRYRLSRQ